MEKTNLRNSVDKINEELDSYINDIMTFTMKNFKLSQCDFIDPEGFQLLGRSFQMIHNAQKFMNEWVDVMDETLKEVKETNEKINTLIIESNDIKDQNEQIRKELESYARVNSDLLMEIKRDLDK